MKKIQPEFSAILAAVIALAFTVSAWAQPSSYPKLYTDGHGLALTRILLEKKSGSSWLTASTYQPNGQYRFKMRFTNYFRNSIPQGGAAYGNSGIHIADIWVALKLVFASWQENQQMGEKRFILMPRQISDHPDFNDTIAPTQSRWFTFGEFTWKGPPAALHLFPLEIYTKHRQIVYMPQAGWGRLIPNR